MTAPNAATEFEQAHYLEAGAARLCYRKAGAGPALVLLHGFPLSGLTWREIVPPLAEHFTCIAFDLVGLGESTSRDQADFSSPGQARLFREALTEIGVSSYALTGNDTGGWIARELALLDGERVTHLALTNTEMPGHRPPWIPLYQRTVGMPGSVAIMRRMLASRRVRRSALGFGGCFGDLDLIDGEFTETFVLPITTSKGRVEGMFRFLTEMRFARIDEFARLHGELRMPVALLWAEDDPTFPVETARAMSAQFANLVHFRTLPGVKLFLHEEQPDAVSAWLLEFLAGGT